jgi:hypothetical protein
MNCIICKNEIHGYGHNPHPLANKGRCCDACNSVVLGARLIELERSKMPDTPDIDSIQLGNWENRVA